MAAGEGSAEGLRRRPGGAADGALDAEAGKAADAASLKAALAIGVLRSTGDGKRGGV